MSLQTLVNIAGMPGMDVAVTLAVDLAQAVQNIKIYRTQCRDLSDRCTRLLIAFREKCSGLEGTEFMAAADEVSSIIERAHKKAQYWASMNRIKSFVTQSEIKLGLEQLYRDIDMCAQQFSIASSAELHKGHRELQAIRERDNAENREILQAILSSVDGLREVLALNEPNEVQHIMQTIQEELQQQTVQPDQQIDFQQGLHEIYRKTQLLPPMIDLTGQVEKTSDQPVAYGAYNDVYTGLWLNEDKVALKFARAINHTAKARKRFHKEVEIWRDLQHPHVSRLYGIVYFGSQIYSVSAWMEHGSALDYINLAEEVIDRSRILGDVASGMEYLHIRGVVHGDLRAANILIDDHGKACVSDFGLSKVIEEVAPEMSSTNHGDSPVRWQARELIKPDDYGGNIVVSPSTDVWSYGMLCLEIMTGVRPYNHRRRDANVIEDLVAKRLPDRPTDPAVISRGLGDGLWNLILHCWSWEPAERPSMSSIKVAMRTVSLASSTPSLVMPNKPLSESPKAMPKDLPQAGPSLVLTSRPSLSPAILPKQPPSPRPSTAPSSASGASRPGFGRIHAGSVSSISSNGSNSSLQRQPPLSVRNNTNLLSSAPINSLTGGALGLSLRQQSSRGSFSEARSPLPRVAEHSEYRPVTRNGSLPSQSEPAPSGLSATSLFKYSPNDLLSSPASQHVRDNSLSSLPMVSVQYSDGDISASSEFFPSTPDLSLSFRRRPPVSVTASEQHSSFFANGLLHSPPSRHSEENSDISGGSISSSFPSSLESPLHAVRSSSSSDVIPPKSSLTDFGGLECTPSIYFNKDGSVKAGSLAGFVDRLIKDTPGGYAKDKAFREMFLTTYRLFASSKDVLRLLVRRFVIASTDQSMRVEDKVATRYLVLDILKQWLKGHYAKAIESTVLQDLKLFLGEITSPPAFQNSARELISTIDTLLSIGNEARPLSPTFTHSDKRSFRVSEISPVGLAIALTVLEGGKYKMISPTDCVSYLLQRDGRDRVAEARATNNKIVNWVKKSVTRSDRMESRGDTLRFFANTAFECRKIGNYSSMSALIAGIDSPTVTRLKLTRGCLDKQMRDVQKKLSSLLAPGHNHRAYRDLLPDPKKGTCIPWLAVHLKDLQSVFERNLRQVVIDKQSVINFDKYKNVYDSIGSILIYQERISDGSVQYELESKGGPLSYLEDQLATTVLGQAAEDRLEARSLELQKQEDRDYEHRVNELAAVGFRTTRNHR